MPTDSNIKIAQAQQLLQQLKESYLAELPEKVDHLEHCLLRLEQGADMALVYEELYRQVHSLKGSAGTYGVDIVTHICHQYEDYLSTFANAVDAMDDQMVADSLAYIDLLRQSVELVRAGETEFKEIKEALTRTAYSASRPQSQGLILDATTGYARMYQNALAHLPIHFTLLSNGLEALELLLQKPFDIIVTSYHLEMLNGLALTCALRRSGSPNANIGVILLTSGKEADVSGLNNIAVVHKDQKLMENLVAEADRLSGRALRSDQ